MSPEINLRHLLEYNAFRSPGISTVVATSLEAVREVDLVIGESDRLSRLEELLFGRNWEWYSNSQLHAQRATIVQPVVRRRLSPHVLPLTVSSSSHAGPRGGLWTSSEYQSGRSTWLLWTEFGQESSAFRGPAVRWRVKPVDNARVERVDTAAAWVGLVEEFPTSGGSYDARPDWDLIGQKFDGVHITLRGVIATQGISFLSPAVGQIAPPYFDVECTVWSNWCFSECCPLHGTGNQ